MNDLLLLFLGLVVLFLSGKYLVTGGVELARHLGLPPLVIGLTIISFGTSAPELLVSLKAALSGNSEIAIGNVVGSNIANIGLILGISALVYPLPGNKSILRRDWVIMTIATVLLILFSINGLIQRWEGILFVFVFVGYTIFILKSEKNNNSETVEKPSFAWYYALLIIAASCTGLVYGAGWMVDSAKSLALNMGVSERIISVSIIAFGTSIPELATSIIAAFKRETGIALGNIVGSNIFNILGIMGITASITPVPVSKTTLIFDMSGALAMAILLLLLLSVGKQSIGKTKGLFLIAGYCIFMYLILG